MTTTTIRRTSTSSTPSEGIFALLRAAVTFCQRRAARRELNALTLEQLRDVGIDPDVISREHKLPVDPWVTSRLMNLM